MVDPKKFTAFITFNDDLRNLYFDIAESRGIDSTWDVYHIQEGQELPKPDEVKIMQEIFESHIKNNQSLFSEYESASNSFRENVRKSIESRK